jgi:hypothetical protein
MLSSKRNHRILLFIMPDELQCMMGKEIWLDPTEEESNAASATFVYAGMPALGTVTSLWQNGKMTPEESIQVRFRYLLSFDSFQRVKILCRAWRHVWIVPRIFMSL